MEFDSSQYIELFFQDTEEQLESMSDALLDLETNPNSIESLSALFRVAHTIKGSSAMVEFMDIADFTHKMENVLQKLRDGELSMSESIASTLFAAFDILREMVSNRHNDVAEKIRKATVKKAEGTIKTLADLCEKQSGAGSSEDAPSSSNNAPKTMISLNTEQRAMVEKIKVEGGRLWHLTITLEPNTPMPNMRAFLVVTNLKREGEIIAVEPDVEADDTPQVTGEFFVLFASDADADQIKRCCMIDMIKDVEALDFALFDTDTDETDETEESDVSAMVDDHPVAADPSKAVASQAVTTLRVDVAKLDILLNLTGELVINRGQALELIGNMMSNATSDRTHIAEVYEIISEQGRILSQLQEAIMAARLVPIGQVFSRFRRVVRDISKNLGKKVNLDIRGEETELDKKIIDQIGEPLTHMVRNAMDHGIEDPETRQAAGKSAEGLLKIDAYHEGNIIVCEVADDGKGIDAEKIKQSAIQKGLLDPVSAETLTTKEALDLVFLPGFSTATEVTDMSGRGVGMDVVRRSIDNLGGAVEIDSKLGQGTSFRIRLPLTLAIIQALLVKVGEELYAIPIANIHETQRLEPDMVFTVEGRGEVVKLRDEFVPLLRLSKTLNVPGEDTIERKYCAFVGYGERQIGLVVDRMVNEQEIVIKAFDGTFQRGEFISGATIMGNGQVSLILDVVALADHAFNKHQMGG